MNQLKHKVAVITGVSRLDGIGAAICKELAEAGYDIFFTYWTAYDKEMPWGVAKKWCESIEYGVRFNSE